ncbi:MAG: hypothetical protein KAU06_00180 [Candidatus Marinimicrobia bacterium]|nr:hypothetical protein [Candidatus Neomarinimicrobiota bacterium]
MIRLIDTVSRNINKSLLVSLLLFLVASCYGNELSTNPDKILEFGNHLFKQKDYLRAAIEYERFLYLSNTQNDTIIFKTGLCHQFRERYDYAIESFKTVTLNDSSDLYSTARLAIMYNYSKLQKWDDIRSFDYQNDNEFYFYYLATMELDSVEWDSDLFNNVKDDSLRSALSRIDSERHRIKPKSALFSSVLSTILPGLGKAYIKRSGDALFASGMTGFAALISWKAFEANLIITGIITSGITLSFYLGTIYGSYIGTQLYNESLKKNWFDHLEEFNPVTKNPYWLTWQKK